MVENIYRGIGAQGDDSSAGNAGEDKVAIEHGCSCTSLPGSMPVVPAVALEGHAVGHVNVSYVPRAALPGVIEVERFGVYGIARARDPGAPRALNVLHQV